MTVHSLPFNTNAEAVPLAQRLRLPVESQGLREILENTPTPPEMQRILDAVATYAHSYFRSHIIPASVVCAVTIALAARDQQTVWKHADAREGQALYDFTLNFAWESAFGKDFSRESSNDWRKVLFIQQFFLAMELVAAGLEAKHHPALPLNYREIPSYRMATEISWPRSDLSAEIGVLATRLRKICNTPTSKVFCGA